MCTLVFMHKCKFACFDVHVCTFLLCVQRMYTDLYQVVVYYSVMSLSFKFHKDLVFHCGDIGINASSHVLMCTRARFFFVCAHMYTDLYQNFCGGFLLCYEFKY